VSPASRHPVPRIRDVPAPRENPSATGPLFRWVFQWPYRAVLAALYGIGVRAWQLTFLSLITNGIVGWLLLTGRRLVPGLLLLLAGMLDIFDGGVARLRGEESKKGALLDATVDRLSDGTVFGAIFLAEATVHRNELTAGLALTAMIVSLLVSHVRAEGEAAGLQLSEGSVQRLERYVVMILGLAIPGALLPALALLAALGLVTTLQRLVWAWRGLAEPLSRGTTAPSRQPPRM
jgi:CDP-diacylglycerol---glycerol-3-phosphate 3-phosphatidyltransferase